MVSAVPELYRSLSYERDARASCGALTDLPQKNVPLVYQFARNQEERQLFKLGLIEPRIRAALCVASASAADRVKAIEAAFQKTLRDPEPLTEAEQS
jgi:hypothetical protein